MAKRTKTTKERTPKERGASGRRHAAQRELPGMMPDESAPTATPSTPLPAPRHAHRAIPAARLLLASPSGSNQQPHARQQPSASQSDAAATPASQPAPRRPRPSGARALSELREALAEGWEIVQPIFARPLWSAADDSRTAYNFVLRRDQATRLLTAPGTVAIERFIETHRLSVDHRS